MYLIGRGLLLRGQADGERQARASTSWKEKSLRETAYGRLRLTVLIERWKSWLWMSESAEAGMVEDW